MSKLAINSNLDWDLKPTDIIVNDTILDSHYALVRDDNKKVLCLHKNSYNPYYNREFKGLLEDFQKITNFENIKYQEYKGGRIVLGYLENTQGTINIGGHDIKQYLVLGNGHDGSKGIFLGTSELMLRCMNQFGKILTNNVVYHTKNNAGRIDAMKRAYEIYFKELENTKVVYEKLSKVTIDQGLLDSLRSRLFELDTKSDKEEITANLNNKLIKFNHSLQHELPVLGNNLFGFMQSVTHYTPHTVTGDKVFGNFLGASSKLNERAYELVTELI